MRNLSYAMSLLLIATGLLLSACGGQPAATPQPLDLPAEILRLADDFSIRLEPGTQPTPSVVVYFDSGGRGTQTSWQRYEAIAEPLNGGQSAGRGGAIVLDKSRTARQALGSFVLPRLNDQSRIRIHLALFDNEVELDSAVDLQQLSKDAGYVVLDETRQSDRKPIAGSSPVPVATTRALEQVPPTFDLLAGGQHYAGVPGPYCWDVGCVDLAWVTPVDSASVSRGETITFTIAGPEAPGAASLDISQANARLVVGHAGLQPGHTITWTVDLQAGSYTLLPTVAWNGRGHSTRLFRIDVRDPAAEASLARRAYKIYYIGDDGNLWSSDSEGRNQVPLTALPVVSTVRNGALAGMTSIALAPDSRHLAMAWYSVSTTNTVSARLEVLDLQTATRVTLDQVDGYTLSAFGPDGTFRAFSDLAWSGTGPNLKLTYTRAANTVMTFGSSLAAATSIWQVGLTGRARPLYAGPPDARDASPVALADGSLLLLRQRSDMPLPALWRLDVNATEPHLVRSQTTGFAVAPAGQPLAWIAPDTRPQPMGQSGVPMALFSAPAVGVSNPPLTEPGWTLSELAWNPDGSDVVFRGGPLAGISGSLWRLDGAGSIHRLTSGTDDGEVVWLPDGRTILFTRRQDAAHHALWLVDEMGGNAHEFLTGGRNAQVALPALP